MPIHSPVFCRSFCPFSFRSANQLNLSVSSNTNALSNYITIYDVVNIVCEIRDVNTLRYCISHSVVDRRYDGSYRRDNVHRDYTFRRHRYQCRSANCRPK